MRLVLASTSQPRKDIFDMLGLEYECVSSLVDEDSNKKHPGAYVKEISMGKALSVREQLDSDAIIVAADTIIYMDGKKYEKPKSIEEAKKNLLEMSGKTNYAYTGITIIDMYQNKVINFYDKVGITFRDITEEEAEWCSKNEEKTLKCCGYAPLGKAALFLEKVNGDYNTLFGISPSKLFDKLKELGYQVIDFKYKR